MDLQTPPMYTNSINTVRLSDQSSQQQPGNKKQKKKSTVVQCCAT